MSDVKPYEFNAVDMEVATAALKPFATSSYMADEDVDGNIKANGCEVLEFSDEYGASTVTFYLGTDYMEINGVKFKRVDASEVK